jgi:cytochrome c-type biogenesis protein CcmH
MTPFLVAVAALGVLVAAALAWPLRRASPRLFAGMLVALPVLAVALYQLVGTPAGLDVRPRPGLEAAAPTLDEAIARLRADLERDPRQPEGWRLLGRGLSRQGDAPGARDAFARAAALAPEADDVLVEFAEARALADPARRFDADAVALLRQVLDRNGGHQRARWFLGIAQRQAGEDAAAAETWEPLLDLVDAEAARALRPQIDAARAAAGLPALPVAEASGHALTVRVALDPALAADGRFGADAAVFVVARAPDGPAMPVAATRLRLGDLPAEVVLDDGDSPMPTARLSQLQDVLVSARISAGGDATRSADDVESAPVRVTLPAAGPVDIVIGSRGAGAAAPPGA